jgi:hypothetical protein
VSGQRPVAANAAAIIATISLFIGFPWSCVEF